MAVRLVGTFHAAPGKGAELTQAMKARCEVSRQDAGCEQFEVFQSVFDPDKLVLRELWKDKAALDAHAKLQAGRPPLPEGLRLGAGEREDYKFNRARGPGEGSECRSRISNPAVITRPRTCLGNGRCRPAPTTARRACAPFAAWSSAAGMSRNWGLTGSASPSTIIRRAS